MEEGDARKKMSSICTAIAAMVERGKLQRLRLHLPYQKRFSIVPQAEKNALRSYGRSVYMSRVLVEDDPARGISGKEHLPKVAEPWRQRSRRGVPSSIALIPEEGIVQGLPMKCPLASHSPTSSSSVSSSSDLCPRFRSKRWRWTSRQWKDCGGCC